jgi:hypothetical protein
MIEYYRSKDLIKNTSEELIPIIDVWYGNYHFSRQPEEPIYNSVMVTYFILSIIPNDHIPTQLIDQNVVISYHKLKHLLIKDKKINDNFLTLKSIVDNGEICTDLLTSFSIDDLFKKDCFLSLLYSFGLLTIYGEENGLIKLVITNKTNQKFLTDFICRGYEEAEIFKINSFDFGNLVSNMAYYGEWKPVFQFLAAAINEQTSIRDFIDGENMVKGFLLAFLNSTNYYVIYPETEMNKGYADQYLEPFLIQYKEMTTSYLIELKYIPRGTKPLTKPAIRKKVNEGAAQLMQYAQDPYVQKTKANTELKKLVLVWQGWELVRMDEVK